MADSNHAHAHTTTVIVETPRGSRAKYSFDPARGEFRLKRALPRGLAFPFDFGFVPGTIAEDGDPLDAIVLWDEASFPGCVIECRLIGVIRATQRSRESRNGKSKRNDRLLVVPEEDHEICRSIRSLADVSRETIADLERFFRVYHAADDEDFTPIGPVGPTAAQRLLEKHRHA